MFDVCCLGILVADITAFPIDRLPGEGKLLFADNISLGLGGCAANAAIDLQKIGLKTAIIGKVGRDAFGSFICKTLNDYEVDTGGVCLSDETATSSALVLVNEKGERSFIHFSGTNGDFSEEDVDFSIIENSKILFVAGSLLMGKMDGAPTAQLLKKAREKGIYTVLDTAWDETGRWMTAIEPCLPYIDLFIPSIAEAKMLSGREDVQEMADVFLSHGVSVCVIKLGKDGCYIKSKKGEEYTIPSYDRIKAKSTNGAGDSFVAGFITGLLKEWNLEACGKFANAVGTLCVSQIGTTDGVRSFEETIRFMQNYENGEIIDAV